MALHKHSQGPTHPEAFPRLLRMKESLLSRVMTGQMCHWAGQEHFIANYAVSIDHSSKAIKAEGNSYSGLFDFLIRPEEADITPGP